MADTGSDCQANSSNDFAVIEDSQSGRDSDGEEVSLSPPKPVSLKCLGSCWTQQLTKQNLILTGQRSILLSLLYLVTHIQVN